MTFDEIVDDVADRLNQTSAAAITRIGKAVNRRYKIVTSAVGLIVGRRTTVPQDVTLGFAEVTFENIEKIIRVTAPSVSNRPLVEVSYEELMEWEPGTDTPTCYAIARMNARSVTIAINSEPAAALTLLAEGLETKDTLEDDDEPSFSESFHDILVEGVLVDEYRRVEKTDLLKISAAQYEARLRDLQLFIAKSSMQSVFQGKTKSGNGFASGSGGSGGGSLDGSQSYTQEGLITFDRNPLAPFAVTASSAVVPNLNADTVDGIHAASFINRTTEGIWTAVAHNAANFTASTGTWTVSSGDQVSYRYSVVNKICHISLILTTTSVSATPVTLMVAAPPGVTFVSGQAAPAAYVTEGAVVRQGLVQTSTSTFQIYNAATGFWATSANALLIYFSGAFEIS